MSKAFDFGKIADGFYYTNRDKEAAWLRQQIGSGINVMLISPRRWGKSSLVQQVADKISKDNPAVVFCFVDLFNIRSEQEFYEALSRQVLKNTIATLLKLEKLLQVFSNRSFLKSVLAPTHQPI